MSQKGVATRLMTRGALALLLATGACSRPPPSPTSSATPPAPPSAPAPAATPVPAATPAPAATHAAAAGVPAAAPGAQASAPLAEGAPQLADSSDLVHIEYHVYGHGDPGVILIHGWACNARYWSAQVDALRGQYTVVTLDLAGHGASGRNRSDWSMLHFGEDVAAVARRLPNATLVLVGHAMGGPVALEAAPLIGPRVIGIIGVDTFRRVGLPPPPSQAVDRQVERFRKDFIGTMHDLAPQLFTRHADPKLVRKIADDMSRAPPQMAIASLVSLNTLDYATVLPRVQAPIVAIDSDLGEPLDAARIRRAAPGFRAVVLKGAGNFLMLEDPQRFNPILLREIAALAKTHDAPASR